MRIIKKTILGALSVLGVSFLVWMVVLLNPGLVYSHSTTLDQLIVYHDADLQPGTAEVLQNALAIAKASELYHEDIRLAVCLNGGCVYPDLHPLKRGTAYAFLNKTVLYRCQPDFRKNTATFRWAVNDHEPRQFDLTYLLAHELVHNLQYATDTWLNFKVDFWKLEGHAEYIARQWKNDGRLESKIKRLLDESGKEHTGIAVFVLPNGTIQNVDYFRFGLMVQYLIEVEQLTFAQICTATESSAAIYTRMIDWLANASHE